MTVRLFMSTDVGAPTLNGVAGSFISLLTACLVNGYGDQTPTTITRVGSVATINKAGHGYLKHNRITMSGWNQVEYNGGFRVESVIDVNNFTINVTGTPATPGTGTTPSMRKSAAGWTAPYTGANLAAFKQPAALLNPVYYRVDDTTTTYAQVRGYEAMSAITTGTGEFPTVASRAVSTTFPKSTTADAVARPWVILVSEGTVWVWVNANGAADATSASFLCGFGDFISYKSGDAWNKFIIGTGWNGSAFSYSYQYNYSSALNPNMGTAVLGDHYIARSYTQLGTAITFGKISDYAKSGGQPGIGSTYNDSSGRGMAYPHPIDAGLYLAPIYFHEAFSGGCLLRGEVGGIWNPLQWNALAHYDTFSGVAGLAGKDFLNLRMYGSPGAGSYNCAVYFEISDTW